MFKKPGDKKADPLADRLRKIAAQPALEDNAYEKSDHSRDAKRQKRDPTFKQATITMLGGERMDVVVKNLSAGGARIEFFRKVNLTEHVLLSEPTMRIKTWAKVMWQKDGAAGLQFVAS
jgi:hypothetical protein